ncbi:MAG: pentapeptide repeat-containing protein [Friedmanniella sp.]
MGDGFSLSGCSLSGCSLSGCSLSGCSLSVEDALGDGVWVSVGLGLGVGAESSPTAAAALVCSSTGWLATVSVVWSCTVRPACTAPLATGILIFTSRPLPSHFALS